MNETERGRGGQLELEGEGEGRGTGTRGIFRYEKKLVWTMCVRERINRYVQHGGLLKFGMAFLGYVFFSAVRGNRR